MLGILLPIVLSGCDLVGGDGVSPAATYEYDFTASDHDWEAFFTGYPVGWSEKMELTADHRTLPESVEPSGNGLFIRAINNSDDVKMLFRRAVSGLEPGATYRVRFTVRFATSAPSGCAGIGGPPGEGVKVLAAASSVRPAAFVDEDPRDYYRLNLQYQRNDPQAWQENAIMGDIANSRDCEAEPQFEMKTLTSESGHATITADENGETWLLFGARSGFEGETRLFYTYFRAEFYR